MAASNNTEFDSKRTRLTSEIANLLQARGVAQIPLREIAAELGTSDRMLLYYFGDKAALIDASVREVSNRFNAGLAAALRKQAYSPQDLLSEMARLVISPKLAPMMHVWNDVAARGARGEEPYRAIATGFVQSAVGWFEGKLSVPGGAKRRVIARLLLIIIEGVRIVDSVHDDSSKDALRHLSNLLASAGNRRQRNA
jgi:AcrR family transcriptional regulator